MINAGKSIWATFKLNTVQSSKYKISILLFMYCCTSSSALFLFNLRSNKHDTQDCCWSYDVRRKMENIWQNLTFLSQWMEHFCCFGYLNQLGRHGSVHSIAFQTHWKENSLSSPPPFRKFTSFRPPYPSEFPWPSVGGMDIFWNHTFQFFSILQLLIS